MGVYSCESRSMDVTAEPTITDGLQSESVKINLPDSIKKMLNVSASKDTFEYEAFYNDDSPYELLYIKTGHLFNSKNTHAFVLHSMNDTTIVCELFYFMEGQWRSCEKKMDIHVSAFSPAYFDVLFDDYNFDGNKDVMINLYQSMGTVYTYGYLLTYDHKRNGLILHPETIEIPSIEIDEKSKEIRSSEYSKSTSEEYKVVSHFKWTKDFIKLVSKEKIKITTMSVKL